MTEGCSGHGIRALSILIVIGLTSSSLAACSHKPDGTFQGNSGAGPAARGVEAAEIISRYRSLDGSNDSAVKLRARITEREPAEGAAPGQIVLNLYRKREADGRRLILIEFIAPAEERDRDGLITVFPDGRIEAVRYVQSTDSFLIVGDAASEDSLFGLTLQELADGQPEKYDFALAGEETYEGTSVYRLDGTLKQGAESKFPRLVLLIDKQNFTAPLVEFYDNHNQLARRLSVSRFELAAGYWTRWRWTIDNRARQKSIDFETIEVKYDQQLSDSIFIREHLKKIASR